MGLKKSMQQKQRYLLLFKNKTSKTKIQKELDVKFTSSAELSTLVKADEILKTDKGLYFKNLDIAIVEDIDEEKFLSSKSNLLQSIAYWEPERNYYTASIIEDQLLKVKSQMKLLEEEFEKLNALLSTNSPSPKSYNKLSWGLQQMGINDSQYTGKGVSLCILDTGIDKTHLDFNEKDIVGKDFIPNEFWYEDKDGHGTHCAGIAAGYYDATTQLRYGVAPDVQLVIAKVLNNNGAGTTSGILDAIDWALEKQYKIISMSLAAPVSIGDLPSPIFEMAGKRALEQNTLLIAAAGNDSKRPSLPKPVSSPANAESIMAVGAINEKGSIATFSNAGINAGTGGKIDILGPGVDIYSTYSQLKKSGAKSYATLSGTSMATPFIAGLAALYWEAKPKLTAKELWQLLQENALKIPGLDPRDGGAGLGYWKQ